MASSLPILVTLGAGRGKEKDKSILLLPVIIPPSVSLSSHSHSPHTLHLQQVSSLAPPQSLHRHVRPPGSLRDIRSSWIPASLPIIPRHKTQGGPTLLPHSLSRSHSIGRAKYSQDTIQSKATTSPSWLPSPVPNHSTKPGASPPATRALSDRVFWPLYGRRNGIRWTEASASKGGGLFLGAVHRESPELLPCPRRSSFPPRTPP